MEQAKFMEIFIKVCNYYKQPQLYTDKEVIREYYEALKEKDQKTLFSEITKQFKWMPKIAELNQNKKIEKYNYTQRQYEQNFLESFYDVGGKD